MSELDNGVDKCVKCRFYSVAEEVGRSGYGGYGRCKRYPPTYVNKSHTESRTTYFQPSVASNDICGEFVNKYDKL